MTAFFLGAAGVGAFAFGVALVLAVLADASGRDALRVGVGGVELLTVERGRDSSATTFGPALVLIPLLGGLLNAFAAALLHARGRRAR